MKLLSVVLSLFALVQASGFHTNQRKPISAPIGLQLYSLRDQFKADVPRTPLLKFRRVYDLWRR